MSISYNCIFPRRTVTLPSVEMWGTNMNIVKQPTRSIHTRRIDKVGDNNMLLDMQRGSMDRIAENISQYARGVNPSKVYEKIQPKTTYKLQLDGAFRAPQLNSGNILPLSRQAISTSTAYTNPQLVNYTLRQTCNPKRCAVKKNKINTSVHPTATYRIDTPISEPYTVRNVIVNPVKIKNRSSGKRTLDITQQINQNPTQQINEGYEQITAATNKIGNTGNAGVQYGTNLHNKLKENRTMVVSSGIYRPNGETEKNDRTVLLQPSRPVTSMTTNISQPNYSKTISHENKLSLDRNTPLTSYQANVSTKRAYNNISSTKRTLVPKLKVGRFHRQGSHLQKERYVPNVKLNNHHNNLVKKAFLQEKQRR